MRLNEGIQIVGEKVVLVPYAEKFVPRYHEWMECPELRELTASERLTLEEEYAMQRTWRVDEDKLTFIILDKARLDSNCEDISTMIGDTNLFLSRQDDGTLLGEIEIMIAESSARGRGFGWEATLLMLKYSLEFLKIHSFVAKIGLDNEKSIRMFQKLKFQEESRSSVFNEITLQRPCDDQWQSWLTTELTTAKLRIEPFVA